MGEEIILVIIGISIILCIIGTAIIGLIIAKKMKDVYVRFRNIIIKAKSYQDIEELVREIDVKYSPAVVSYLMNQQIEPKKDLFATILKLYAEKVINIEEKNGNYFIIEGKNSKKKLGLDEEYIYNLIMNNQDIDFIEWEKAVKEEYNKYNFSKNGRVYSLKPAKVFCTILTIPTTFILYYMFIDIFVISRNLYIYFNFGIDIIKYFRIFICFIYNRNV